MSGINQHCERKGFQTVTQVLQQSYFSSNCLSFIEDEKNSHGNSMHTLNVEIQFIFFFGEALKQIL